MSKYRSKKSFCNQMHKHASKKEATRCDELTMMERGGLISILKQQPRIVLKEKFVYQGKVIKPIIYIADFSYFDSQEEMFVVEDVKGFKTDVYKLKVKLLKFIMRDRDDFLFVES